MEKLPGMPDLAPGYFWRLRIDSDKDLRVSLFKRGRLWNREVAHTWIFKPHKMSDRSVADEIVSAGKFLIINYNRGAAETASMREIEKLEGDWK